ncbi:MAG TPA: 3-hydroxyacyl-ACP dehydratase FabZ [Thermodesulfovibrionales bacterium]|nr:3-hydroxyacyl-ACP dehydratase FabZ [Thermodesulfovibrionales bacterium]
MTLNFEQIKALIPQRFPFIMIDRIIEMEPGEKAVSIKNVSGNDIFFLGHFPDKAVFPGAAIIEAMAQTAIVLFAASSPHSKGEQDSSKEKKPLYYFGSVKARFLNPVVPGDQIKITVINVKSLATGAYVSAEAFVEDKKISEAELVFSVKDE